MKRTKRLLPVISTAAAMLLLILDAETALRGARQGIQIAMNTLIPTLLPFILLSSLMMQNMIGRKIPFLHLVGKVCGIPYGSEFLMVLGFACGYPVGAKVIADYSAAGQLDRKHAQRMLGFCSNAGPAFIFGLLPPMFCKPAVVFLLWGIHILSAMFTAIILPGKSRHHTINGQTIAPASFRTLLFQAEKTIAEICGLVILFRIVITFMETYFLWHFPPIVKVIISGILELSNGCLFLHDVDCEALRLILCACMLSFGGICVTLQTISVTNRIGMGMYLPGKLIQCAMSFLMVAPAALLIYGDSCQYLQKYAVIGGIICIVCIMFTWIILRKKHWKSAEM